ncbi:MAG: MFS transporter [Planctomycetota bacterium]|jgi:UMF1 family MFS transporter
MAAPSPTSPLPAQRGGTRTILAWSLYDFGNSAFATLIVTFVYAAFFTEEFAATSEEGTALWSRGVTITAIVVALSSPFLGAVADRGGYRKAFLLALTATCIAASIALYFVMPGHAVTALVLFVIANIAFEMASVFYNAFLPDVAPPERIGRVSGYGWGLQNVRATTVLVAVWFGLFSIPLFLWVKEDKSRVTPAGGSVIRTAWTQLVTTFHELRTYRQTVKFLIARLVFNDGLITIFAFGGIYAAGTFDFSTEKLVYFGILLNVTAAAGAFVLGFLDDILGGKKTILITLAALIASVSVALLARSESLFWVASAAMGIFVGPNQAASRSLMGRFVPPDKENEFFGFFAFSGKATAFLGPFLLGVLTTAFDSQRVGLSIVLVFFAVGGLVLWTVDEEEGIRAAGRS